MNSKILTLIKNLLTSLGLKRFIFKLFGLYAKNFQHHICKRNGINYCLDLSEAIDLATYFGGWEPETITFIENNVIQGNYVIEVGANVGIQTLHFSQKVGVNGRVFAFEPTEFAVAKLNRNCDLNSELSGRISIFKNIVTDEYRTTQNSPIRSSWQTDNSRNNDEFINASLAISIDEFIEVSKLNKFDILKIDVDGYDFKVLQGSKKAIMKFNPLIYIELDDAALNKQGDSVKDILNFLINLGYVGQLAKNPNQMIDSYSTFKDLKISGHVNVIFTHIN
jgi:FkbM family methyltransferase